MRTGFDRIATRIVILAFLVLVWVFTVSITVPQLWPGNFDYGFFTAVAERLRAGDVLYEEVWDNKDPFVFYSIALARTFGPAGAWALELAWVVLTSGSVFAIARRVGLDRWLGAIVAFAATPIAILGVPYFMGSSHMPGIALTLLALAFLVHGRPIAAGIPIAFLIFFKFVMLPLAIAVLVTWAIARKDRRAWARVGASFAITAALIAVVLQIRGELLGFITTQVDNILYSQSPIVSAEQTGLVQNVAQHIVILINPNVLAVEFATAAILVSAWIIHRRSKTAELMKSLDPLWWTTAVAFVASIGIIAATGKVAASCRTLRGAFSTCACSAGVGGKHYTTPGSRDSPHHSGRRLPVGRSPSARLLRRTGSRPAIHLGSRPGNGRTHHNLGATRTILGGLRGTRESAAALTGPG